MFCAFRALDIAPTLDVPVLFFYSRLPKVCAHRIEWSADIAMCISLVTYFTTKIRIANVLVKPFDVFIWYSLHCTPKHFHRKSTTIKKCHWPLCAILVVFEIPCGHGSHQSWREKKRSSLFQKLNSVFWAESVLYWSHRSFFQAFDCFMPNEQNIWKIWWVWIFTVQRYNN